MRKLMIASIAMAISCGLQAGSLPKVNQEQFRSEKSFQELPDGIKMAYFETGNPKGKPFIFIHGFTDSSRTWTSLFPYLDNSYRYIFLDLRGHGDSTAPRCCYSLSQMAYDVKLLMDKLKIDKAFVAGHSLGSIVTQTLAEKWPERVEKAILVGSGDNTSDIGPAVYHEIFEVNKVQEPIDPHSKFMDWWMGNFAPDSIELVEYSKQDTAKIPLYVWREVLDTISTEDYGRRIGELKTPVLVMNGENDGFWSKASQEHFKTSLPTAEVITYPTGHNIHWEQPQKAASDIMSFVRK
jgi:pimeloyl-ACP methyl ester carboxylesterase